MRTLQAVAAGMLLSALGLMFYGAGVESAALWPGALLGGLGTVTMLVGSVGEAYLAGAAVSASTSTNERLAYLEQRLEAMERKQAIQALR